MDETHSRRGGTCVWRPLPTARHHPWKKNSTRFRQTWNLNQSDLIRVIVLPGVGGAWGLQISFDLQSSPSRLSILVFSSLAVSHSLYARRCTGTCYTQTCFRSRPRPLLRIFWSPKRLEVISWMGHWLHEKQLACDATSGTQCLTALPEVTSRQNLEGMAPQPARTCRGWRHRLRIYFPNLHNLKPWIVELQQVSSSLPNLRTSSFANT